MGMDIYGRNPSTEEGTYFRASIWRWTPILHLMASLCDDFLSDDLLRTFRYNEGHGIDEQAICTKIADRFDAWMERNTGGAATNPKSHELPPSVRMMVDDIGRNLQRAVQQIERKSGDRVKSIGVEPMYVSDEQLKEWVAFLRHCGGFAIH